MTIRLDSPLPSLHCAVIVIWKTVLVIGFAGERSSPLPPCPASSSSVCQFLSFALLLPLMRWPCAAGRTFKSNYYPSSSENIIEQVNIRLTPRLSFFLSQSLSSPSSEILLK